MYGDDAMQCEQEDAADRLTYYEVETRSPEAWRSDMENCIIEKMLDENK